ncbi:hypothetical protein JCM6882_004460 [Rhodosporidiobolus microsporus]
MARTKPSAGSSSSPDKSSDPGAAWRAFLAKESARLKLEHPKLKHKQIVHKCSVAYQKMKEDKKASASAHGDGHEVGDALAPSSEMGEESQTA